MVTDISSNCTECVSYRYSLIPALLKFEFDDTAIYSQNIILLNGFYNLFYEIKNVGRLVNSLIMLFVNFSKMSNSHLIITTMVKQKNKDEWVLSVVGRHTVEIKQMTKIHLDKKNGNLKMTVDSTGNNKEIHAALIKSELI